MQARKPIYDDFDAAPPSLSVPVKASPAAAAVAAVAPSSGPSTAVTPAVTPAAHTPRSPTPTDRLATQIRQARLFLYHQACTAEDAVNGAMDRAFHLEKSFTDTVASLAPPRESGERLMPGLVYVLVAAMAGSIVTRRSNVLLRAAAPLAFGTAAGWAVIPRTMTNVSDLASTYEQRVPAVADAHRQTREGIEKGVRFVRVHAQLGANYLDTKITEARETVEEWTRKGK